MLKKILIVDEKDTNRTILTDMLKENYDILSTDNQIEANKMIKYNPVSAVIVGTEDCVFEMVKSMKTDENLSKIPVLVCAGVSGDSSKAHANELGVYGFITKPYNTYRIQQFIKNICYNDFYPGESAEITC